MRGSMLKEILQEQGISISELARRLNVSAQTLYSMVKRDNQKVDFDMMMQYLQAAQRSGRAAVRG